MGIVEGGYELPGERGRAGYSGDGISLVVVGVGGIGSHLVGHLARMRGLERLMIVDKDRYDETNVRSQDIVASDVGRPKAVVQARQVKRIRAGIEVEAVVAPVQEVPLGRLAATAILAAVDSRGARQAINEIAWRLGKPWIDAAISADGMLARLRVYRPSMDSPCLECSWDQRDYGLVEQTYPCDPGGASPAPTNAPSSLSALAAAWQAIELEKLLSESPDCLPAGWETVVDARHHGQTVTAYRRNPCCRFDHQTWRLEQLDRQLGRLTLGDLVQLVGVAGPGGEGVRLSVAGQPFAHRLSCPGCGETRGLVGLAGRVSEHVRGCRKCGGRMAATGFDVSQWLDCGVVRGRLAGRRLTSLGFRPGDVVTAAADGAERHLVLWAGRCEGESPR